ncbi:hypothetical protein RchiOBHm_Chr1g0356741 [Rosa chinensis]|uniref:Uncharacterized protein n=1 Tax=Rosa chinensis TaxID=74649 RepID=A0A2P6SHT8_ROSCH|nr:hypothetical protein RchiOBHm_Chr1g0356741 [Rosa chinensis]
MEGRRSGLVHESSSSQVYAICFKKIHPVLVFFYYFLLDLLFIYEFGICMKSCVLVNLLEEVSNEGGSTWRGFEIGI